MKTNILIIFMLLIAGCSTPAYYQKDYVLSGYNYEIQGLNQSALEEYLLAVKENPDNDTAWTNLGNIYTKQGENEKAIEAYKKALVINKNCIEAMNNLACVYIDEDKNINEAIVLANKAISLNPEELWCYYDTLGWAYCSKHDYKKAKKYIKKAIKLCPLCERESLALIYYHLAAISYETKNKSRAIKHYNKALSLTHDKVLKSVIETNIKLINGR